MIRIVNFGNFVAWLFFTSVALALHKIGWVSTYIMVPVAILAYVASILDSKGKYASVPFFTPLLHLMFAWSFTLMICYWHPTIAAIIMVILVFLVEFVEGKKDLAKHFRYLDTILDIFFGLIGIVLGLWTHFILT